MRLPLPLLMGLLTLAFLVLIGLGVWQLQRNEWKQDLVQRSHARTDAPPLEITDSAVYTPSEVEYRRVRIRGEWAMDDVMFLANRARATTRGEEIIVPVRPANGPAVLVNMGWMPDGAREQVMAELDELTGAEVAGLAVDGSSRDGHLIPSGSWSGIDLGAMSDALGYEVAGWFVLAGEERTSGVTRGEALPVQGWQRFQNTTPHLQYALTWFGLAVVLIAVAVSRFLIAPKRERAAEAARSVRNREDIAG